MSNKSQWLKTFFLNNWGLKVLAVMLAILTLYAVRGATSYEVVYDIPLEVEVEGEKQIAILNQDPRTIYVTFRGSREDIRLVDQNRIRAIIRPKATDPAGSEKVPISAKSIEGFSGVRVVQVRPATATLTFDREVEKTVPVVKPKTIGIPLTGKAEVDYEPRFVVIRGPRRRLKDKNIVSTEPIDVDGRVESFSKSVRVLSPGDTWVSQIEPSEIMVNVTIVTESVSREWTNVLVAAVMKPGTVAEVDFEPETISVLLLGRAEVLESIPDSSVKVFVDCVGLDTAGVYELPVNVYLPAGMDVNITVKPETVKVTFRGP